MILINQTKLGVPEGNCFAACVASVLELPLDSIPVFNGYTREDEAGDENAWWLAMQKWIEDNTSYSYCEIGIVDFDEAVKFFGNTYWIGVGKSPRGDFNHAVVYRGSEMVHDPHPKKEGLRGHPSVAGFFTLKAGVSFSTTTTTEQETQPSLLFPSTFCIHHISDALSHLKSALTSIYRAEKAATRENAEWLAEICGSLLFEISDSYTRLYAATAAAPPKKAANEKDLLHDDDTDKPFFSK